MPNRLKLIRKVNGYTQEYVASLVNIGQSTYSCWETGKVKIDDGSIGKLAEFYHVSSDFLMGFPFVITRPVSEWESDLQEDYKKASPYIREYMEYKYGRPVFHNLLEKGENAESLDLTNAVIICRKGKNEAITLTDAQLEVFEAFLAAYKKQ